jgi:hypothetical protein
VHRPLGESFVEDAQEGSVVGRFLEQRQACHGSVQDAVDEPARSVPGTARKGGKDNPDCLPRQENRAPSEWNELSVPLVLT